MSVIFSYILGDKKLYIALALMTILAIYFYLRLDSTKVKLEKNQNDLALALKINENNQEKLKELNQINNAYLKALNEANNEKNQIQEKVSYVKKYIYTSNENNLTKLFNDVVNSLWDDNPTSNNQNRNSKN